MKKELTAEQINQLFSICEKYDVKYYDVQIELVDHMACQIEAIWETKPQLSFDDALYKVLKEFGVDPLFHASYGSLLPTPFTKFFTNNISVFDEVKKSKEKELVQKYSRLQRKYLGEFIKLPKIILTITLVLVVYFILQNSPNSTTTSLWIVGAYSVFLLLFLFVFYPKSLRLNLVSNKSFLLFKHYNEKKRQTLFCFWGSINLLLVFTNHSNEIGSQIMNALFASILSLFIIASMVMAIYIPRRIKEDFMVQFPQFSIS